MLLRLTALVLLAMAAPAAAQTPPAPSVASDEPAPSPRMAAAVDRIEAAGAALETMMQDLEPHAAAVRADASLADADKEARIRAMFEEHQPVVETFGDALAELIAVQALEEGGTPEAAAETAGMARAMVTSALLQSLITGEEPGDIEISNDGD